MKTDHAHVEAAMMALVIVVVVALFDLFVDVWDGEPVKQLVYLGLFVGVYLVGYVVRRRAWNR